MQLTNATASTRRPSRSDSPRFTWSAAVLISICGLAQGQQVGTYTGGSQAPAPGTQPNAQPQQPAQQPQQPQTNVQATGSAPSQPVDASLNAAAKNGQSTSNGQSWSAQPQEQPAAQAEVADPFAGQPGAAARPGDSGNGARGVKSIRPNAVKVDDNGVVDLRVNGEEVTAVLEMLSLQSQKNIIPYKNVNGKVFANLYGVTFYEALDALLHANGFGYVERGNFIYVYTLEDLQKLEKESRQRVWKVIKLNYLSAVDAASFAQALLSKDSVIKTNAKVGTFPGKSDVPGGAEDYPGESTIMVFDFPEQVEQIEKLVKELDTRPAQVLVEATILQAQLSENNAFGVDFAVIGNLNFGDFISIGGPLRVPDSMLVNDKTRLVNGAPGDVPVVGASPLPSKAFGLASTPGNVGGPGTLKLGLYNSNVGVFVKLLDEVTDTTILSNPKILALNRQAARVLIGERVGYLNTTSTNTATTQTVEFLDTGTQLHFRPFVGNDNTIRLELKPSVSSAVVRDVRSSAGGTVTVPDEITNELTTNVIVRDGQTVVLGGLFRDSTQTARRQVPLLGDIPLVGYAFRGQEDTIDRQEIIFLVTPTIVSDTFLAESGDKTHDMIARVRAGAREGLLPFSRERMTSQMIMDARKLAAEGQTEKALWKLHMALSINPHQEDAMELQEKLSGKKENWPDRSMLDELLGSENRKEPKVPQVPPAPANSYTSGSTTAPSAPVEPAAPNIAPAAPASPVTAATQPAPSTAPATAAVEPAVAPVAAAQPIEGTPAVQLDAKPKPVYVSMNWKQAMQRFVAQSQQNNASPATPAQPERTVTAASEGEQK